jgi:hypothetical protein
MIMDCLQINNCAINIITLMITFTRKFLLEEAEQFFNERVKEILKVCIGQLVEVFLSASNHHN